MTLVKTQERKEQNKPTEFLTRLLPNAEIKADNETRTLTFPFSSTRPVERWAWYSDDIPEGSSNIFDEVLSHNPSHWRLERVEEGVCPYLKNHSFDTRLGKVLSVSFDGDRAVTEVKLRRTKEADEELDDARFGTSAGVSFGYRVHKYRVLKPAEYEGEGYDRRLVKKAILEGVDIELFEISSCAIPADPSVGHGKSVNLRTLQIEGDPLWEKASPDELKKGDFVAWNSSGGTSRGKIDTVARSGTIQAVPTGPSMEGSPDNPAFLVTVWSEESDGWQATDTKVVKRASSLTEITSLKSATATGKRKSTQRKSVSKKPKVQKRELMLSDYLTVESPTWDDIATAFAETLAAIDTAIASDETLDMKALYHAAIMAMYEELHTLYDIPKPDMDEDTGAIESMDEQRTLIVKPTEQETERDRQFKAMQEKVQFMERREAVTRRFTTLRQKAAALKSAGKLTPAGFEEKFGDLDAGIDFYTKSSDEGLNSLEDLLNYIEKFTPAVEFGSQLKNEPLEAPEKRSAYDAELEAYKASRAKK